MIRNNGLRRQDIRYFIVRSPYLPSFNYAVIGASEMREVFG